MAKTHLPDAAQAKCATLIRMIWGYQRSDPEGWFLRLYIANTGDFDIHHPEMVETPRYITDEQAEEFIRRAISKEGISASDRDIKVGAREREHRNEVYSNKTRDMMAMVKFFPKGSKLYENITFFEYIVQSDCWMLVNHRGQTEDGDEFYEIAGVTYPYPSESWANRGLDFFVKCNFFWRARDDEYVKGVFKPSVVPETVIEAWKEMDRPKPPSTPSPPPEESYYDQIRVPSREECKARLLQEGRDPDEVEYLLSGTPENRLDFIVTLYSIRCERYRILAAYGYEGKLYP